MNEIKLIQPLSLLKVGKLMFVGYDYYSIEKLRIKFLQQITEAEKHHQEASHQK